MGASPEETRRDFLIRLARAGAFVPSLMLTVDVAPLLAGGKGGGGGKGSSSGGSTVGSLSPTAAPVANPFNLNVQQQTQSAPWDAAGPAQLPPWARRPPGTSGTSGG